MSVFKAIAGIKSASVEAKVIRADGTVEDLGTISYWHQNPLKRLAWRLSRVWERITKQGT